MLISTHFHDLYDTTQEVHYENFRAQCIAQMTENVKSGKVRSDSIKTPTGDIPIVPMVTETDKLLLQKEEEIRRMQEMLAEMQQKLKQRTVDV
jgi:septin 4